MLVANIKIEKPLKYQRRLGLGNTLLMKPIVMPIRSSVENLYGMTTVYVGQISINQL